MLSATTETLRLISAHPGDLRTVSHPILAKAAELCGGEAGSITLNDGGSIRYVASHGPAMEPYVGTADAGGTALNWLADRYVAGLCAIAAGACQEALRITAEYASNRKQFEKPIAMLQAVGQRMADSFIDNEAANLTMWQAASRLADEMPSDREIATAKYWTSEGGSRIGHAGLHIHGGISIDVDDPIHRYFLWLEQIEFTLGAATPQLVRLGVLIAAV